MDSAGALRERRQRLTIVYGPRRLGERLGAGALRIDGWADPLECLERLEEPFLAIDDLPYLTEATPELPSLLWRSVLQQAVKKAHLAVLQRSHDNGPVEEAVEFLARRFRD